MQVQGISHVQVAAIDEGGRGRRLTYPELTLVAYASAVPTGTYDNDAAVSAIQQAIAQLGVDSIQRYGAMLLAEDRARYAGRFTVSELWPDRARLDWARGQAIDLLDERVTADVSGEVAR